MMEKKFSDECYKDVFNLFSSFPVTKKQRNNAKAHLKKDLATYLIISNIIPLLSIVISVGIVNMKSYFPKDFGSLIIILITSIIVIIVVNFLVFYIMPSIKKIIIF
mgnify:CR=1 FL=1